MLIGVRLIMNILCFKSDIFATQIPIKELAFANWLGLVFQDRIAELVHETVSVFSLPFHLI